MDFKTKKLITKFRSYASIFLAILMLSTSFVFRILANRNGIMKNITMADSVVTSNQSVSSGSEDNENKNIKNNEKLESKDEDLNNSIVEKDNMFLYLTNGGNIKFNNSDNDILNFLIALNGCDSKEIADGDEVYTETLTSDAIGVYSNNYTKLPDDAYNFTKITVPGKNSFKYINGNSLTNEKCVLKIQVLNKGKTRKLKNFETIYENEWKNETINKDLANVKAVRVEISGLKGEIDKFNINIEGNADISDYLSTDTNMYSNKQNEYKTCYVISENFSECFDKDGNDMTKDFAGINYLNSNLYKEDYNNYGKGLLRTYYNLKVQEQLKHTIILTKYDCNDGRLLENAEYGLYTNKKINIDDKTYMPGELIESNFTDKKGEIKFEIYGFLNNFYIKEIAPPTGYYSSDFLFKLSDLEKVIVTENGIKIAGEAEKEEEEIIRINAYDEKKKENNLLEEINDKNDNSENNKQEEIDSNVSSNGSEPKNNSNILDVNDNVNENREIKINKIIKADTLISAHGDACFIFKIASKDARNNENITLYRIITFTADDKQNVDSNGNIEKSIVISNLPAYNYEITEEVNSRYSINHVVPIKNAIVDGNTGIVNLEKNDKGEITFKSNKNKNSLLSDSKMLVNKILGQ